MEKWKLHQIIDNAIKEAKMHRPDMRDAKAAEDMKRAWAAQSATGGEG